MRLKLRPRSGCLGLCLCVSVLTLLLQGLWVPPEGAREGPAAGTSEEHGQRGGPGVRRLALRLEALSSQVQRLAQEREAQEREAQEREAQEREALQPASQDLSAQDLRALLQSLRQDQEGLVRSVQKELQRLAQKLDRLDLHPSHTPGPPPHTDRAQLTGEECKIPVDPAFPLCADKVQFLLARWQSDPCYGFYGVDGTICSILTYLSQREDFCPPLPGTNHSAPPWLRPPIPHSERAQIRTTLGLLYEAIGRWKGPAVSFIRSRAERLSGHWIRAGRRINTSHSSPQMKVLLYPGVLAGVAGQRFGSMVERGGPLGELVQWADLSASLVILGHHLTLAASQEHLHSLIGAAPGKGSCPIQWPLTFDLVYTDYHGLAHLQGAMGLAFQHYQCRFRVLDSFGTEPAFNLASYARSHGYNTLWGNWGLQPLQYMTMFPHSPDNSFLGFVSEQTAREEVESELDRKDNIAVVYGKQEYMWQGKEQYLEVVSRELETHGTVYQPTSSSILPRSIINHGLLTQDQFLQLLRRAKVFVGLGFPYEGPAPLEAIASGCVFLQPRFLPPRSAENTDFYRGKPTTREVNSQHPYVEDFIGKPYVWTVDTDNSTDVQQAIRAILQTQVKPFTPREFTCEGMLERVKAYITHQDFCQASFPTWPAEGALRGHLGPLGESCVSVCRRSSLVCEPALFHHLNSPASFTSFGLDCSSTEQEVNHLLPAYSPWGRRCGLQKERLLFSCAGSDPSYRRLCPCREHLPGQVALCPGCL